MDRRPLIVKKKHEHEVRRWARGLVRDAIARGDLAPQSECLCFDCGKPAEDYDHRDYAEPLDVQPVCKSCNGRRGPGRLTDEAIQEFLRRRRLKALSRRFWRRANRRPKVPA